jgi:hypothetical protein
VKVLTGVLAVSYVGHVRTNRERYTALAATVPAHWADSAEENAAEMGLAVDSDEFFTECFRQLAARVDEERP